MNKIQPTSLNDKRFTLYDPKIVLIQFHFSSCLFLFLMGFKKLYSYKKPWGSSLYSFILTEKEAHGNNKTPHNLHQTTRPNSGLQRIREVSLTMQFGRPNGGGERWAASYKWDYKSYKYHGNPQPSFLGL